MSLTPAQLSMLLEGHRLAHAGAPAPSGTGGLIRRCSRRISLVPIRTRAFSDRACSPPPRPARRSGDVAADPARGAGRDRAAAAADRRSAAQPVRPPLRAARRRPRWSKGSRTSSNRWPSRRRGWMRRNRRRTRRGTGCRARHADASRERNRGALPAHLPRVEVVVDVEDKTACPLLRRLAACDRRRPRRDAGLRAVPSCACS